MKNLTADQILKKTFEHLDQVLKEKEESEELLAKINYCKQSQERKRKVEIAANYAKSRSSL